MIEIEKLALDIYIEKNYVYHSVDNKSNYNHVHHSENCDLRYATECIGIRCQVTGLSTLLVSCGSFSGLHDTSYLVDADCIIICVGNNVFSVHNESLTLNWVQECDSSSCFQIFPVEQGYLIHGEMQIALLSKAGKIDWTFSGRDIFVTADETQEIELNQNGIKLLDWEKNEYFLDYKGNVIEKQNYDS